MLWLEVMLLHEPFERLVKPNSKKNKAHLRFVDHPAEWVVLDRTNFCHNTILSHNGLRIRAIRGASFSVF